MKIVSRFTKSVHVVVAIEEIPHNEKRRVASSVSSLTNMSINKDFLTAVYHDCLDDCDMMTRSGRIYPPCALVDGLDALSTALLSPHCSFPVVHRLLEHGCDPFNDQAIVMPALLMCADANPRRRSIASAIVRCAKTFEERKKLLKCLSMFPREDVLREFVIGNGDATVKEDQTEIRRMVAYIQCKHGMDIDNWTLDWLPDLQSLRVTPFHIAAFHGNAKPFLSPVCDSAVNAKDHLNRTPLIYAIHGGQSVDFIVRLLIERLGASVDDAGDDGTALMAALRLRRMDLVKELASRSDLRRGDRLGRTAMHTAFAFLLDTECVEALRAAGGDVTAPSEEHGWPPIFYSLDSLSRETKRRAERADELSRHFDLLTLAIKAHGKGDLIRCGTSQTLLMHACLNDLPSVAAHVLKSSSVPPRKHLAATDESGRTAYHWACHRPSKAVLEFLRDADLLSEELRNIRDEDGHAGHDLLLDAVETPAKHREWPGVIAPAEMDEITDFGWRRERVIGDIGIAHAKALRLFDLDIEPEKVKPRTCAGCFRLTLNPKRCARCKEACYCSRICQIASWPLHKNECFNASPTLADALSAAPKHHSPRGRR
jgi:ankyrin repeat protein